MTHGEQFIKVTMVRNNPGNDKCVGYVRATEIVGFNEAPPEHAKVGGASMLDTRTGTIVIQESCDDLIEMLSKVVVDP